MVVLLLLCAPSVFVFYCVSVFSVLLSSSFSSASSMGSSFSSSSLFMSLVSRGTLFQSEEFGFR